MNRFTEFFPYGTHYYRAPTPLPEEWEGDLAEIKKQGYTHVQYRVQWRWHERIRGEYVWDDLDELFDLAEKYDLKVVLQPMMETAPDWVYTELQGNRIGFHGKPLDPISQTAFYVGGFLPCFDNPDVAEAVREFITVLVNRYKNRKSMWFYDSWNEPRSRPMGQCTCKHSVRSYRDHLRREYGTIENLNKKYGKAWTSFETVMPPHSPSDYVELFMWRRWAGESVAAQVELVTEAIRKADPTVPVMCHIGASSVVQDPACDTSRDLLNSTKVDWYGCSLPIELSPSNPVTFNQALYQSSWQRRVDSEYWCYEFYPSKAPWSRRAHPGFVEQAVLMAIASGCRGFTFWQYRSERYGEESDGYGMRNIDGTDTPRSLRCDRIANFLAKADSDFAKSSPRKSKVAVYFDDKTDLLMRIQLMLCPLMSVEEINEIYDYTYKKALQGAHATLRRLGYTADFIVEGDDLTGYDAVVVSALEMTDDNVAKALTDYVNNGGSLLVEYPFACRDNTTWVSPKRPNSHLDELTGCREVDRSVFAPEVSEKVIYDTFTELTDGWHVTLEKLSESANVLATWEDGTPSVVENRVGKGSVITSAGNFAMYAFDNSDSKIPYVYTRLLENAGLPITDSPLWIYSRYSEGYEYRFVFNTTDKPETVVPEGEVIYSTVECETSGNKITLPLYGSAIIKIKL